MRSLTWIYGVLFVSFSVVCTALAAQTQETSPSPDAVTQGALSKGGSASNPLLDLAGKALIIKVNSVYTQKGTVLWSEESNKITTNGIEAPFRMVGDGINILLQITPFKKTNGKIQLYLKAQNWIRTASNAAQSHIMSSVIFVDMGEEIVLYPLGINKDPEAVVFSMHITVELLNPERSEAIKNYLKQQPLGTSGPPEKPLPNSKLEPAVPGLP